MLPYTVFKNLKVYVQLCMDPSTASKSIIDPLVLSDYVHVTHEEFIRYGEWHGILGCMYSVRFISCNAPMFYSKSILWSPYNLISTGCISHCYF